MTTTEKEFAIVPQEQEFSVQQEQSLIHVDPMLAFIERAAKDPGFDAVKLRELLQMRRELRKDAAREAFAAAMAQFKKNAPIIYKDKKVSFGTTNYKHASLENVCDEVIASLNQVDITHRWFQEPSIIPGKVRIVCRLTHILGHSEDTGLEAPDDQSGGKNPIQAVSSSSSYLQRYTLLMGVGVAVKDADNDGRGATEEAGTPVPDATRKKRINQIEAAGNNEALKQAYLEALHEAQAVKDMAAQAIYSKAKNQRYRELHAGVK